MARKKKIKNSFQSKYGDFLGAMSKRVGESWKYVSDDAIDLFDEAERLNLNPSQFIRNYKYWLAHGEELANAKPIDRANVKPSDYAKQLGLPKIRTWNNEQEEKQKPKAERKPRAITNAGGSRGTAKSRKPRASTTGGSRGLSKTIKPRRKGSSSRAGGSRGRARKMPRARR